MLMHLVKIPLVLRLSLPSDATSLMQLQAASGCAPQAGFSSGSQCHASVVGQCCIAAKHNAPIHG